MKDANETATSLEITLKLAIDHIIEELNYYSSHYQGIRYADMTQSDFTNYECDRAAYVALSRELSFIRGVARDLVEVPEVLNFPIPYYDH